MKVQVCKWKTCTERFREYVVTRLENDKKFLNKENVIIEDCMCLWQCKSWPNIVIDGQIHNYAAPAKASELVFSPKKKKKKNANSQYSK